jgi:ribonucleotide monophosphatase NagD (HAD superfamily)
MDKKITICCDLDGVIRQNGRVIKGAKQALKWLESKGREVIICTASDLKEANKWLKKNGIKKVATNIKPKATVYIDDRAVRFINWDDTCNYF